MLRKEQEQRQAIEMLCVDMLVPKEHLLRKVDAAVDFKHIYELVEELYCEDNGRPSIDPVVLFKLVLIQHLFGIRSLRQTMREVEVNVAYRWFLGYTMSQTLPHFATASYAFRHRFTEEIIEEVFRWIYMEYGNHGKKLYRYISGKTQDERNDKIVMAYIESGRIREFMFMMPPDMSAQYCQSNSPAIPAQNTQPVKQHPFDSYAQEWYKRYKGHLRTTTAGTQKSWLDSLCDYFSDISIESIGVDMVQDYVNSIQHFTTGNIEQKLTFLSEIFNAACEDGYIDKNPAKSSRIKAGGKEGKGIVSLSREDVKALTEKIRSAEDLQIKYYLALMLYAGLRREEMLGLRWEDIDFGKAFLHIQRAVTYPGSKPVVGLPKTKSSNRTVPIPDELMSILREHRKESGYLVADKNGELYSDYKVKLLRKAAREYSGLPELDARQLRHSYASMLHAAGVETRAVGTCMGHTKSATTDRYIQVEKARLSDIRNAGLDYALA